MFLRPGILFKGDDPSIGKLRLGFIGTGGMSISRGQMLKELDEVEIVALADPNDQSRMKFKAQLGLSGVKEFSDYKDLFLHGLVNAVVICSPHSLSEPGDNALRFGEPCIGGHPLDFRT